YKDSKKPDDGIGDLIIWQTILEISKANNKDILFVTNDQKNDWFYKQDKIGLYPKYELFDEFRRFTEGKSVAIVNFVKFLELSEANEDTINEVKTTMLETSTSEFKTGINGLMEGMEIEHPRFGKGQIQRIDRVSGIEKALVSFGDSGQKYLVLKFTPLKVLDTSINFLIQNPDFDGDPRTYQLKDVEE
ncbi:MAG: PIN-like domain-containing protein, partial [Bacteroidota bacterium]